MTTACKFDMTLMTVTAMHCDTDSADWQQSEINTESTQLCATDKVSYVWCGQISIALVVINNLPSYIVNGCKTKDSFTSDVSGGTKVPCFR